MGLGIVSDDDFDSSLEDCNKKPNNAIIIPMRDRGHNGGRNSGDVEVPNAIRSIIGETSEIDGRNNALELARSFGISDSSVSAYAHGVNSTSDYNKDKNPSIVDVITKSKVRIGRRASKRAAQALELLTEERMNECDAVQLAQVAKSMSSIVTMMEPDSQNKSDNRPQIIQFFAPPMRQESQFETIVVKE